LLFRGGEKSAFPFAFSDEPRAHHGGKREGHKGRNQDGTGHYNAKLPEESAGKTLKKNDRQEDRSESDGGGDDRKNNLL